MDEATHNIWLERNQAALCAALALVRAHLSSFVLRSGGDDLSLEANSQVDASRALYFRVSNIASPAPALETLCSHFSLSEFERLVLLVCAGMELDATFSALCASAQGEPQRAYPTFSLMLSALPDAHWSALSPDAPLRRWRLIEFAVSGGSASAPLTTRPLRIDERVLHYLTGVHHLDERLTSMVRPLRPTDELTSADLSIAQRTAAAWSQTVGHPFFPLTNLHGAEAGVARAIAAEACASVGLNPHEVLAHAVPSSPGDLDAFIRLWEREVLLSSHALVLDCNHDETRDSTRENILDHFIEQMQGGLIVISRERRAMKQRSAFSFEVRRPSALEQCAVWKSAIGDLTNKVNGQLDLLTSQFSLSAHAIHSVAARATSTSNTDSPFDGLWDACREETRSRLDGLAQRIEPAASWDDLVLPDPQKDILHDVVSHVRQRAKIYERWGFASKGTRGLGISALFAGASGTGKTMAAEVLARELHLDIYRIDLSSTVSKYIGETEKNLRRVFDAAEGCGAILLFDEADALFGKRSEVRDSHDRYANIEVSYLLQRMESYRGLAILTTNTKDALDGAFLRRIRFIVHFLFPDLSQRTEIWRGVFPTATPTSDLDFEKLGQLSVTGGNIRNIALNAAFYAADKDQDVHMSHVLHATRSEYAKLEKPLTEAETAGWMSNRAE